MIDLHSLVSYHSYKGHQNTGFGGLVGEETVLLYCTFMAHLVYFMHMFRETLGSGSGVSGFLASYSGMKYKPTQIAKQRGNFIQSQVSVQVRDEGTREP